MVLQTIETTFFAANKCTSRRGVRSDKESAPTGPWNVLDWSQSGWEHVSSGRYHPVVQRMVGSGISQPPRDRESTPPVPVPAVAHASSQIRAAIIVVFHPPVKSDPLRLFPLLTRLFVIHMPFVLFGNNHLLAFVAFHAVLISRLDRHLMIRSVVPRCQRCRHFRPVLP